MITQNTVDANYSLALWCPVQMQAMLTKFLWKSWTLTEFGSSMWRNNIYLTQKRRIFKIRISTT
jgi:hypothetical protein